MSSIERGPGEGRPNPLLKLARVPDSVSPTGDPAAELRGRSADVFVDLTPRAQHEAFIFGIGNKSSSNTSGSTPRERADQLYREAADALTETDESGRTTEHGRDRAQVLREAADTALTGATPNERRAGRKWGRTTDN